MMHVVKMMMFSLALGAHGLGNFLTMLWRQSLVIGVEDAQFRGTNAFKACRVQDQPYRTRGNLSWVLRMVAHVKYDHMATAAGCILQ